MSNEFVTKNQNLPQKPNRRDEISKAMKEIRDDIRRAVMMARENRQDIARLNVRVADLEATVEEMRTLI